VSGDVNRKSQLCLVFKMTAKAAAFKLIFVFKKSSKPHELQFPVRQQNVCE
jgi:hypothetical protein